MRNWLFIGLLVLQTLTATAIERVCRHDRTTQSFDVGAHSTICASSRQGDRAPAPDSAVLGCCVLCVFAGGLGDHVALSPSRAPFARSPSLIVERPAGFPRSGTTPLGWASSWSSRAPPLG